MDTGIKLNVVTLDDLIVTVLDQCGGQCTTKDFQNAIDAAPATLSAAIGRCVKKGLIVRTGRGRFVDPSAVAEINAALDAAREQGLDCEQGPDGRVSLSLASFRALLGDETPDNSDYSESAAE